MRVRSAWARMRLSYSGRKRSGAGMSGSGSGASGRSSSSRPCSSRRTRSFGRSASTSARSPLSPDHSCTSATRRGPERGEIAQDHLRGRAVVSTCGALEIRLGEHRRHGAAHPPRAARRDVDERQQHLDRVAERVRVVLRPSLGEPRLELRDRVRPLLEHRAPRLDQLCRLDASGAAAEVVPAALVEHRLQHGAQTQVVARGDEVLRRAHHRRAHDAPLLDQLRQLVALEVDEPSPESDVRRIGELRLERDQSLDPVEDGHLLRCSSICRASAARLRARRESG